MSYNASVIAQISLCSDVAQQTFPHTAYTAIVTHPHRPLHMLLDKMKNRRRTEQSLPQEL